MVEVNAINYNTLTGKEFFTELLNDTKIAFERSKIKEKYGDKGWGYSVTAIKILKNKPLIVGFNWGVDTKWVSDGNIYGSQIDYPSTVFEENFEEMGSLKRTIPFFKKCFPEALQGMQTNICFFRSERESQVDSEDIGLSLPLFEKYLNYSTPGCLISFSKHLKDYLENEGKLINVSYPDLSIKSGRRNVYPVKAKYRLETGNLIDFVSLPHPNSPITSDAREKSWLFCFSDPKQNKS